MILSGWGRYPTIDCRTRFLRNDDDLSKVFAQTDSLIARGNGRAYGDAALNKDTTLLMRGCDRFLMFDKSAGLVECESGLLLSDLLSLVVPHGWFPPVVPGTKLVTIGGLIAADVHGKNHHRDGSFGDYVESLLLATGGGDLLRLSREENSDVFLATLGGMGLTGTILEATIRLAPVETGWIRQRTIVAPNLAAAIAAFEANEDAAYSVAWIDCIAKGADLGRSLVYLGEHARLSELDDGSVGKRFPPTGRPRLTVPIDFPNFVLNHLSISAFNELYYRMGARRAGNPVLVEANPYFFPLDAIGDWNRIYGGRGFVQHQCVLPIEGAPGALAEILERVARRGDASFLAVLKKLRPASGLMSFPMGGYTLALDFAVSPGLMDFLETLDETVVKAGGRLYLAKDARQSRDTFAAGYPALDRFQEIRRSLDPARRIRSRLAERLAL
jgi:decaprenylphospho-beta-D-ribofuranose 2-oxidase